METLKDVLDTFANRLKSPIFGYVITSFIIVNWRSILFLFSDSQVAGKISYFDSHTTLWSLVVYPLAFGVAAALASPWVSFWGALWAETPTTKTRILTLESNAKIARLRNQLREEQVAEVDNIIKSAKQDIEVQKIENEQLRKFVESKIIEIRDRDVERENTSSNRNSSAGNTINSENYRIVIADLKDLAELAAKNGDSYRAHELIEQASKLAIKFSEKHI